LNFWVDINQLFITWVLPYQKLSHIFSRAHLCGAFSIALDFLHFNDF